MKKFLFSLRTELRFSEPARRHTFMLRATPVATPAQEPIRNSLICSPACNLGTFKDAFGNIVKTGYLESEHEEFVFCSTGEVTIDTTRYDTKEPAPCYSYNYSMTKPEGELLKYFHQHEPSGTVDEVVDFWLCRITCDFRYEKNITSIKTTASEAWELGSGVCQDFSHILIALLRSNGIPCRYVAGLLAGEGASHAWVEYFNGKHWIGVDPTHNTICNDNYMKLSHGPDFSACSLEKGVFLGGGDQYMFTKSALLEL